MAEHINTTVRNPGATATCEMSLEEDMCNVVRMIETLNCLWEVVRLCIVCATNGDAEDGRYGPVGGLDWALAELREASAAARRKAESDQTRNLRMTGFDAGDSIEIANLRRELGVLRGRLADINSRLEVAEGRAAE